MSEHTFKDVPTHVLLLWVTLLRLGLSGLDTAVWHMRQTLSVSAEGGVGAGCGCDVAETGRYCAREQLFLLK